jgi:hypothetical protein
MEIRKRYDETYKREISAPDIDAFLDEVIAVFRKHNMTLSGVSYEDVSYEVHRRLVEPIIDEISNAYVARPPRHLEREELLRLMKSKT